MADSPSEDPVRPAPAIVDLVFAGESGGSPRRLALGCLTVVSLYTAGFTMIGHLGRSAGPWSAEMAARVHDTIASERSVDVTPPTPTPPAIPAKASPRIEAPHVARASRTAAPAQAAQVAAASPAPVDFTGMAFVVGGGSSYAGGSTTSPGTSRAPASGNVAPGGTGRGLAGSRIRARAVSLDQAAWNCPWPSEADAQQVNEQTVVLRAIVRADGRAERVDVMADPGFGFGEAARLCAQATRFEPARDAAGQSITTLSPPIRVHFFR